MTIYSFIIRHSFPNLLYVTYLHDVLYVCASSICFCYPKGTIMKIRSILTCIMLSLPQYLNCKTFRCICCGIYLAFTYLLTYVPNLRILGAEPSSINSVLTVSRLNLFAFSQSITLKKFGITVSLISSHVLTVVDELVSSAYMVM